MPGLERISIDVTNQCAKACWFCYNHSAPDGKTHWTADELVELVRDCADHEVKAVSFGGGEPFEFEGISDVIEQLRGVVFRSITTNGLPLSDGILQRLTAAAPDKVHLSIHFPDSEREVQDVIDWVKKLAHRGIRSGINFLVARSKLNAARRAAERVRRAGISNERITYLPMRGADTPSPDELASVAGNEPFQSTSCLLGCGPSPRFCSIRWDKTVAWCSHTSLRRPLDRLTYHGVFAALNGLGLSPCSQEPPSHEVR